MMGVMVKSSSNSLPIIHFLTDRVFLRIMTGIGLFSNSIHSIRFAFAPLELFFFSYSPFPSFLLFILSVSSHPFIVTLILLGMKKLLILFLIFRVNELNEIFSYPSALDISNRRFLRKNEENFKEV